MKRTAPAVFLFLFLFSPRVPAQSGSASYLLPQTIFVGDPGRLVVPLSGIFAAAAPFVMEEPGYLNTSPDLVIRRVELEQRGEGARLLVDFISYVPGRLAFPAIELPSAAGTESSPETERKPVVTGLEVEVASILNPSDMALSGTAAPLAVPGTSFLIYGTIALVMVLLALGTAVSVWGRRHSGDLWERFRRRRLLRVMAKFLRRLRAEGCAGKKLTPGFYLTVLSNELREFLSRFTGTNCRSFTPGEFLELPPDGAPGEAAASRDKSPFVDPVFLSGLFRSWDILRFSGQHIDSGALGKALDNTESFIAALEKAEKERPVSKAEKDGAEAAARAVPGGAL